MRHGLIVLWMVVWSVTSAVAQVSIGIGLPGVSIGINLPFYPDLVRVPGYPVYYAPRLDSNFFFYDGMYWVYQEDDWYASSWYSGPWARVAPAVVPLFILRVPVSYYRNPPAYFRDWRPDAPPRWGQHWGKGWEQQRSGWNQWNRRSTPAAAPLPVYQQRYAGDRYPPVEQQQALHNRNYRYQPRDAVVRQHYQEQGLQGIPSQRGQQRPQGEKGREQAVQSSPRLPHQPAAPGAQGSAPEQRHSQEGQRSGPPPASSGQRSRPDQDHQRQAQQSRQPQQQAVPHQQTKPKASRENAPHGASQEPRRGHGQDKERVKGEEHGQDRNR
ncbi:MAG TPA: hypothetical protein PLA97_20675 [Rubrivivax sp.]|nr:hypothetical protein [Rubrivivax sp.]